MTRLGVVLAGSLALLAGPPLGTTHGVRAESDTSGSTALFSSDGPVATLTRSTFISSVLESDSPAMVVLYDGSDCAQCEEMSGMLESASEKLSSWGVSVGAVDLSTEPKLAKELGMRRSSPSPMVFKVYHSASSPNPYGGIPVRSESYLNAFQDARTLQKRVLSAVPDLVVSVDVGAGVSPLKEALSEREEGFAAVLFTEAEKASPALRILASGLSGRVAAVQARVPKKKSSEEDEEEEEEGGGAKDALSGLLEGVISLPGGIPSVPSLVLVDKHSGEGKLYGGAVDDAPAMMAFIRDGAGISDSPSTSTSSTSTSGGGNASSNEKTEFGGVLRLDPDSLAELEEKGTEALVLAFVNGGDTSVIPGWSEATKGLQGQIRCGVVDCEVHPSACQGTAKNKAPHLRVYPHGTGVDKDRRSVPSVLAPSEIKEAIAEAEASLPEIVTVIPAGTSPQAMQQGLQGFINNAMVGGAPMVLFVLSKKEEPNVLVKTIAAEFQTAKVATMFISQPDQETLGSIGVKKLPAMLLMFQAPADGIDGAQAPNDGQVAMMTALYSPVQFGALSHRHVSDFVLSHLSNISRDGFFDQIRRMRDNAALNGEILTPQLERILNESDNHEQGSTSQGGGDDSAATPFQGIHEATSETWASMVGEGAGGGGVPRTVGVFLLDRYSESFGSAFEAAELAAERAVGRLGARGGEAVGGFVWVDAPCQEEFARMLGVSDTSEVPVLVVFSPKHQKSARFVGAWGEDSLATFLGKALGGRAPMFPVGDTAPRLEAIDCSERAAPTWMAGGEGGEAGGMEEDDMGDFMAEILAEEAKAKRELEAEVARGLEELKEAEVEDEAPKKRTKTVKKRKKKKSARSEL